MKINISRKGDLYFAKFWERELNWKTLPNLIEKYGICPNTFLDNARDESKYEQTNFLVLDFDNNSEEKLSLMDAQMAFPYKRIIATTKSHQIEKISGRYKKGKKIHPPQDRFRVFLRLNKPINDQGYFKYVMRFLSKKYPAADPQAMSVVSFFQPGKIFGNDWNNEHLDFISDDLPSFDQYQIWKAEQEEKRKNVFVIADHKLSFFTHMWLNDKSENEWHSRFFISALDIRLGGYSEEECIEILKRKTGVLESDDIARVRNVYAKELADITPRSGVRMTFDQYQRYLDRKEADPLRDMKALIQKVK